MPEARTRTSTSASPTAGTGTSRTSSRLYSDRTSARISGRVRPSPAGSLDLQREAQDVHVGRDEQRGPVLAERAVARRLARGERAQEVRVLVEDVQAAGAGREQVSLRVHLHAVGQPL